MDVGTLDLLFISGVVAAGIALVYFLFDCLRREHEPGEYHVTWAVGIVVLFLLGLAPGFVGLGLYLTVEKGYHSTGSSSVRSSTLCSQRSISSL